MCWICPNQVILGGLIHRLSDGLERMIINKQKKRRLKLFHFDNDSIISQYFKKKTCPGVKSQFAWQTEMDIKEQSEKICLRGHLVTSGIAASLFLPGLHSWARGRMGGMNHSHAPRRVNKLSTLSGDWRSPGTGVCSPAPSRQGHLTTSGCCFRRRPFSKFP